MHPDREGCLVEMMRVTVCLQTPGPAIRVRTLKIT
jgi:hypothetical protein